MSGPVNQTELREIVSQLRREAAERERRIAALEEAFQTIIRPMAGDLYHTIGEHRVKIIWAKINDLFGEGD